MKIFDEWAPYKTAGMMGMVCNVGASHTWHGRYWILCGSGHAKARPYSKMCLNCIVD